MNKEQEQYYNISSVTSVHNRHHIASQLEQQKKEIQDESEGISSNHSNKQVQIASNNQEEKEQNSIDIFFNDYNKYNSNITQKKSDQFNIDGVDYDVYGNQEGEEFDLGKDGAFNDFSIVAGIFFTEVYTNWNNTVGAALKKKGFRSIHTTDEQEFISILKKQQHDVAIMISGSDIKKDIEKDFKKALLDFHCSQRGLFIFGDNDPFFGHANVVLPDICNTVLIGDNRGGKLLKYGENPNLKGYFDQSSMIFAGINSLFEGITICYPKDIQDLQVIATGTDGMACICQKERSEQGGRVVIDSGFTKLYCNWDSAGQARYVINACVYLVDIEGRFGGVEPTIATKPTGVNPELINQIDEGQNSQIKTTQNADINSQQNDNQNKQCSIF